MLQVVQNKKIRAIVHHAYEHVPFYHRKFDEAGVKPGEIRSAKDLHILPLTTKTELQAAPLNEVLANTFDVRACLKKVTSGSTGVPLTIVVDKRAEDLRRAMWGRAYTENGLSFTDKLATIKDPRDFISGGWLRRLMSYWKMDISIFDSPEQQVKRLGVFRPDVIKGYVSSLAILADFCRETEREFSPHHVFTGAELLLESDRKRIGSAFGCDVLDYYGSTEFSLLGWECESHAGYHINADGNAIELVKGGEVVSPGERGEIVCTGLINYAMPLIRYKIGDIGVSIKELCPCGRSLPLLKMTEGRTGDFLVTLDGRLIPPTAFSPYPFGSLEGIRQFRITQEARDRIVIQLVFEKGFSGVDHVLNYAREEIRRVFGIDMQVDFQLTKKIEKDPTGKLRKIMSRVHAGQT
jgi:phenylacetate-CoA ligase